MSEVNFVFLNLFQIPVFADFDRPMRAELVTELVREIEGAGGIMIAMVSDMAQDNRNLWTSLGVTTTKPWFHKYESFG